MSSQRLVSFPGSLAEQLEALWARQSAEWPRLVQGLDALRKAQTRTFEYHGATLLAQSNPARIASTSARVDAASIAARPCFLCEHHLPVEQLAVRFGQRWMILSNPAPVFEPHFTIVFADHEPQRIIPALETVLELSRELGEAYSVFYNGPKCGASAPDHLHLQAARHGRLPFDQELAQAMTGTPAGESWIRWLHDSPVRTGVSRPKRRPAVILAGGDRGALLRGLTRAIHIMGDVHPAQPEPMLNLLATFCRGEWRFTLFPRAVHRPACYGSGPGQFLISPGSADLGGILIVPRNEDFVRLTGDIAGSILDEVLLCPRAFARLAELL